MSEVVKILFITVLFMQVVNANTFIHPSEEPNRWTLVFEDEFLGNELDRSNWNTCHWWNDIGCTIITNNELQWYLPENASVQNGQLVLTAIEQDIDASNGRSYRYTSGMVTTGRSSYPLTDPPKFAFTYGYAEMRATVPEGAALWPAFWLLPITNEPLPEIDIMEILGQEPDVIHTYFAYGSYPDDVRKKGSNWRNGKSFADWHTFAVNWQPDAIVWYVDGTEVFRMDDWTLIPWEPMYLIANLAVGGDWAGKPDETTSFPSSLVIDHIRVWQLK